MIGRRNPEPLPDLGAMSELLAPRAGERRGLQVGLAVAAVLHAAVFAVTWPSLARGERPPTTETARIFPVRVYEFTPPDPVEIQVPQPTFRPVAIPDADPDGPEPEPRPPDITVPFDPDPPMISVVVEPPPFPEEASDDPVWVGVDVQAPRVLHQVDPRYPEAARIIRKQGAVVLQLLIDEHGSVAAVTVLRGLPFGLTEAALEAVRQWRFEPSTVNRRPVAVRYNLTVQFRLE